MLRARFKSMPDAFSKCSATKQREVFYWSKCFSLFLCRLKAPSLLVLIMFVVLNYQQVLKRRSFFCVWNSFIKSLREEDFISDRLELLSVNVMSVTLRFNLTVYIIRERDILMAPSSSSNLSVPQWPPFLLASKVHTFYIWDIWLIIDKAYIFTYFWMTRYLLPFIWLWTPKKGMSMSWSKKLN